MTATGPVSAESGLSAEQQSLVRKELQAVLDSQHFSKSKRYPALLEYVVLNTLEGNSSALKERIVGAEVFGRSASYDPGTDPVVRIAAGEVRRRLAEYYNERPDAQVRIELPRGGYLAEFRFRPDLESLGTSLGPPDSAFTNGHHPSQILSAAAESNGVAATVVDVRRAEDPWWRRNAVVVPAVVILLACVAVAGVRWHNQAVRERTDFWWPVLNSKQPAMIVVGRHTYNGSNAATNGSSGATQSQTPSSAVAPASNSTGRMGLLLDDVIVTAQTCNIFRTYGHDCVIKEAQDFAQADFRGKSIVLLGAFNNQWTRRVTASLPYQVQNGIAGANGRDLRAIEEHTANSNTPRWMTGQQLDPASGGTDYAVIARFHSDLSNSLAIWVAGLGPEGTSGAGQFLFSPDQMTQVMARAPKGWNGAEFEVVLQVNYKQGGEPTSINIMDARFW